MGAGTVKSIQYSGNGVNFQVGQSYTPGMPWPRFVVKSFTRTVSYETNAIQDQLVRTVGRRPRSAAAAAAAWRPAPSSGRTSRRAATSPGTSPATRRPRRRSPWPIGSCSCGPRLTASSRWRWRATPPFRATRFPSPVPGRFRVRATVNSQNLVEKDRRRGPERRARRHAGRDPVLGLQGLRRREVSDEDPAGDRRLSGARPDGDRRPAQRGREHRDPRDPILKTACAVRARDEPDGGRRRLVRDRRHPSQRRDRDEGSPDPRGKSASTTIAPWPCWGGQEALEQADQVRHRQPPPLRSLRWSQGRRGRGRDRHRPRREQGLFRVDAWPRRPP